jgi:hypothetical protein
MTLIVAIDFCTENIGSINNCTLGIAVCFYSELGEPHPELNLSLSSLQTGGESSFPLFILGVHTL